MDCENQIHRYYQKERHHAYVYGTVLGLVLVLIGVILLTFLNDEGFPQGVAIVLTFGGSVTGIGGFLVGVRAGRELPKRLKFYRENKQKFIQSEFVKVDGIHKRWIIVRLFWSILFVTGLLLFLITIHPIWEGVGVGLIALGLIGTFIESQSMKHNEAYYYQVVQMKKKSSLI